MRPTNDTPLRVPGEAALLTLLKYAPFDPQRFVLERLLREAYPEALRDGAFEPLRGRWLRLELLPATGAGTTGHGRVLRATPAGRAVTARDDADPGWNVTLGRDGLVLAAAPVRWDVRIAASLDDFVLLANQQADPDTLFFQRRLVIEGDTELGLVVKHLIFGNELSGLPARTARLLWRIREMYLSRAPS